MARTRTLTLLATTALFSTFAHAGDMTLVRGGSILDPDSNPGAAPASAASGPSSSPIPAERQGPPRLSFELGARGTFAFSSSVEDGDVSVSRVRPTLGLSYVIDERTRLNASFEFEYSNYDFSGDTQLGPRPDRPWRDIYREGVFLTLIRAVDERWSYVVGAAAGFSHEEDAKVGDSFEGGGFVAVNYSFSESLRLGLGVGVFSQIEDDVLVIPVPTVDWTFAQGWRLTNNNRPGVFVEYSPSEQWKLLAGAEWQSRDFRLAEDGPVPNGVGRDRRVPIALEVTYTPTRQLELAARAGVDVMVNYRIADSSGNRLAKSDGDPAPFVALSLSYRF